MIYHELWWFENPVNPSTQPPMERDMENYSEAGSSSMPGLEGVLVEEEGFEYHLSNAPIMDPSVPSLVEKPSSWNASFVIPTPSRVDLNQFHPDGTIDPIFGPNAPFWETSLGQAIYQFGTTNTMNVSTMYSTPNSRIPFPYFLPSDILGRPLNIPSSVVSVNPPFAPMVYRLATPSRVPQSAQNPF